MATARFVKTGITPDQYEQMRKTLCRRHPAGWGRVYAAAVGEDGLGSSQGWDSREQAEAWGEKVMAVRTEVGFGGGPPSIEYLEATGSFNASRFGTSKARASSPNENAAPGHARQRRHGDR